jgi:hypothetical protein
MPSSPHMCSAVALPAVLLSLQPLNTTYASHVCMWAKCHEQIFFGNTIAALILDFLELHLSNLSAQNFVLLDTTHD